MDTRFYHIHVFRNRRGVYTPFQVPLPAHKPMPFTVSTTENALRETKQNPHFPLLTANWWSLWASSIVFTKARVHLKITEEASAKTFLTQRLNKCLNVSCLHDRGLVQSCSTTWSLSQILFFTHQKYIVTARLGCLVEKTEKSSLIFAEITLLVCIYKVKCI